MGGWLHIGALCFCHGYALEAVSAFLPAIMAELGISEIYGTCLGESIASVKVMEKCGFTLMYSDAGVYHGQSRSIRKFVFSPSS